MNYINNKEIRKGFAFLTDKRVYFKGSCLSGKGRALVKSDEERTVDVKNITGSGFTYHRFWGKLFIIMLVLLISVAGFVGTFAWYNEVSDYGRINIIGSIFDITAQNSRCRKIAKNEKIIGITVYKPWWDNDAQAYCYEQVVLVGKNDFSVKFYKLYSAAGLPDGTHTNEQYIEAFLDGLYKPILAFMMPLFVILLLLGVAISALLFALVNFVKFLAKRRTLFRIEYAGGCIAFDVSFYAKAEIYDFQKQLRRAKDFAEETATIKTVTVDAPVQAPAQSSVPDDLRKYADLLKEGLISQEEYEAMKKKILGL